jgi:hypothetical protein
MADSKHAASAAGGIVCFVAHVTRPNGDVLPGTEVVAVDRRSAAMQVLRTQPAGSIAACRPKDVSLDRGRRQA